MYYDVLKKKVIHYWALSEYLTYLSRHREYITRPFP